MAWGRPRMLQSKGPVQVFGAAFLGQTGFSIRDVESFEM